MTSPVLIATGLPPGWVEIAAFPDEETMVAFVSDMIDADGDLFTAEQREQMIGAMRTARAAAAGEPWLHLGFIVTDLPHGPELTEVRTTLWTLGTRIIEVPDFGDVSPIGLAERLFGQMATYDRTDAFTLDDGRSGVILTGTVDVTEVPGAVLSPDRLLPGMDPSALGLYVCLLPVSGLEHRIGITVAIAPQASEVTPLSWLANQMATSIHAVDDPRDYPSDNVLVDPTGTVHPGRYLGASNRG